MSVFIGARVGIGRELGPGCSYPELLCDLAGMQPTYLFAFSCLWSDLHAVFMQELEATTNSQAFEMLERGTPAILVGDGATVPSEDVALSNFSLALQQQSVAPKLALRVMSFSNSMNLCTAAAALQQLQRSKHIFVHHAADIIGSRELLLSNWFQRMGGRVLSAVTGGGHTSERVLAWMQVMPFAP
jgi:long-subunit acyl-CoA synthetase (AMP-forming)